MTYRIMLLVELTRLSDMSDNLVVKNRFNTACPNDPVPPVMRSVFVLNLLIIAILFFFQYHFCFFNQPNRVQSQEN